MNGIAARSRALWNGGSFGVVAVLLILGCVAATPPPHNSRAHAVHHIVRTSSQGGGTSWLWVFIGGIVLVWLLSLGLRRKASSVPVPANESAPKAPPPDPYRVARFETLTPIATPFALGRNEQCYAAHAVNESMLTDHVTYQGGYSGMSFRVARGVYMRSGGSRGQRVVHKTMDHVDSGTVYLTTDRLVFNGPRSALEIKRTKVAGLDRYADGVVIKRTTGKPVFFGTRDVARLAAHLERFVAGTLDKPNGGVEIPKAEHVPPVNASVTVTLNGAHDRIVAAVQSLIESLDKEVSLRSERRTRLAAMPAPAPVTLDATGAQAYMRSISANLLDASKMAASIANFEKPDTPEEYIRKLILRYAVVLEALLDAQEAARKAVPAVGFEQTGPAIIEFLDDAYEEFAAWPDQSREQLNAFTAGEHLEVHLQAHLDANPCVEAMTREAAARMREEMGVS